MKEKIAVIGGGPAGMIAAGTAGSKGKSVILFEKNDRLGKKLLITGGGRCNITNACDIQEMIDNVITNGDFLYSAFYTFSNKDIINLLHRYGVDVKIEEDNRVFPVSDKASDVIEALIKYMSDNDVDVRVNKKINYIERTNKGKFIIKFDDNKEEIFDKVIIATGGKSYPQTGSTGDGYYLAEKLGHTIVKIKPALVPLEISEIWVKELQGLSLSNVKLSAYINKKKICEMTGELVFTHYGISGPIVLEMSNYITKYIEKNIKMKIDFKPDLSLQKLEEKLIDIIQKNSKKSIKNSINELLPRRIISTILKLSGVDEDKISNQITKDERRILISNLKGTEITVSKLRPIDEAIVTSGGVSTLEINPSTMESKIISGLFFAGEVIDVDALTGGFNLQIAYSTGYLAGINC